MPEIVALTVNSPILLGKPSGVKSVRMYVRNLNVGPMKGVPYITEYDSEQTARVVRKGDARLMDVTPFSKQQTVKVRVMDNQLSIERSIAVAAILEALALKAKNANEWRASYIRVLRSFSEKSRSSVNTRAFIYI